MQTLALSADLRGLNRTSCAAPTCAGAAHKLSSLYIYTTIKLIVKQSCSYGRSKGVQPKPAVF